MENIYSYIKNRGAAQFSEEPFNEADNLVFCVLCYLDLSEVVPAPGKGDISLYEAARQYFGKHGIPKTADDDGTCSARSLQRVLLRMAMSPRYRRMRLSGYTDHLIADPSGSGLPGGEFAALAIRWMPGHVYIALRGTSDRLLGWKEDFHLMTTGRIPSQKEAVRYLGSAARQFPECLLQIGGHSKGGHLALYAAAAVPEEIKARIEKVWVNDGPGLEERACQAKGYAAIKERIVSFAPEASVVAMVYPIPEGTVIVASAAKGLVQHDAKTWLIRDGHLVKREARTKQSVAAGRKLHRWFDRFSAEEQMHYTDVFFDILYATGAETFPEIRRMDTTARKKAIQKLRSLPGKDRRWMLSFLVRMWRTSERLKGGGRTDKKD